ncbi:MAG: hypothetical protein FWH52_05945 [Synergistaceae bacterium]|nr:hypothetical protein [Synergistaceae bacterium]
MKKMLSILLSVTLIMPLLGCTIDMSIFEKKIPYGVWQSDEPYILLDINYKTSDQVYWYGEYEKDGDVIDIIILFETGMQINIRDAIDVADTNKVYFVGEFSAVKDELKFRLTPYFAEKYGYKTITFKKIEDYKPPNDDEEQAQTSKWTKITEFIYNDFESIVIDGAYSCIYDYTVGIDVNPDRFKLIEVIPRRNSPSIGLIFVVKADNYDFLEKIAGLSSKQEDFRSHNHTLPVGEKHAYIRFINGVEKKLTWREEFGSISGEGEFLTIYNTTDIYNDFYFIWVYQELAIREDGVIPKLEWHVER